MKTTSYWFIFWNLIIYASNVNSLNHLIKFAVDSHFWAEFFEIAFELLGISIVIQSYLIPTIEPWFVNTTALLLPLPAINSIVQLGIIASNKDIEVQMLQTNVIVNGNDMSHVMRLALT